MILFNMGKDLSLLLEELSEDIIDGDFSSLENYARSNRAYCYHVTDKTGLLGILDDGTAATKNFLGKKVGQCFGRGIYGTWDETWRNQIGSYGYCVMKFIVKDRFKNYILFDREAANIFKQGKTVQEQCEEIFTPQQMDYANRYLNGDWSYINNWGIDSYRRYLQWKSVCSTFWDDGNIYGFECHYYEGGANMVVVKRLDSVLPYKYTLNGRDSNPVWENALNPENFDKHNRNLDLEYVFKREYPLTTKAEPIHNGFGRIMKTNTIGNYASSKTYSKVLARDVEEPTPVILGNTATFKMVKRHWKINFNDPSNIIISRVDNPDFILPLDEYNKRIEMYFQKMNAKRGVVSESKFTEKTYDEFMQQEPDFLRLPQAGDKYSRKGNFYVYHVTGVNLGGSKDIYKNVLKNGFCTDFSGGAHDPTLYHGLGAYTFYDFKEGAMKHLGYSNGSEPVVVKFLLKDGLKDFIIFDDTMREAWDPGHTPYDEIVRLTDPKYLQELDKAVRNVSSGPVSTNLSHFRNKDNKGSRNLTLKDDGLKCFDYEQLSSNKKSNNGFLSLIWKMATQGEKETSYPGLTHLYKETLLAHIRNRGTVYYGGHDGPCVFVRDTGSLIPVAYMFPNREMRWITNEYLDKDGFEYFNNNTYPFFRYRHIYPDIQYKDKNMHIKYGGENGDYRHIAKVNRPEGVNYFDTVTDRRLFPSDLEEGSNFNTITREARIKFKNIAPYFILKVEDNGEITIRNEKNPAKAPKLEDFITFLTNKGLMTSDYKKPLNEAMNRDTVRKGSIQIDNDEMVLENIPTESGDNEKLSLFAPRFKQTLIEMYGNSFSNFLRTAIENKIENNPNIKSEKAKRQAIDNMLSAFLSQPFFADNNAAILCYQRLYNTRDIPMGMKQGGKDWWVIISKNVQRFTSRRDEIKKTIKEKFQKLYSSLNNYKYDAYNFYIGYMCRYPDGLSEDISSQTPKQQNAILQPYFDNEPYRNAFLNFKEKLFNSNMALRSAVLQNGNWRMIVEAPMYGKTSIETDDNGGIGVFLEKNGYNQMQRNELEGFANSIGFQVNPKTGAKGDKIYFILKRKRSNGK